MLEGIETGDRVINSLGEEATVITFKVFNNGRCRLYLDSPITGWIECKKTSWSYEADGKFVREPNDKKASNLVKVLRHD